MLVRHEGKIWEARKVKEGYRLKHPVPEELLSEDFTRRFVEGIREAVKSAAATL